MVDTKNFVIIESEGYSQKSDAYATIRSLYAHIPGITTYYSDGQWYIVQSKALAALG